MTADITSSHGHSTPICCD